MPLIIKNQQVVEDDWELLPKDATVEQLVPGQRQLVPLALWLAEHDNLLSQPGPHGLWLDSDEEVEQLEADLGQLEVIALNFPAFTDGRQYSGARILRERFGYKGEIRAIGDVLRDQLFYMHRCGFDAFAVRADRDPHDALKGLQDFSVSYQAATDASPLFRRR